MNLIHTIMARKVASCLSIVLQWQLFELLQVRDGIYYVMGSFNV
jgi:hypothetical protein